MIDERAYELLCCQLGLANEEKAGLRKQNKELIARLESIEKSNRENSKALIDTINDLKDSLEKQSTTVEHYRKEMDLMKRQLEAKDEVNMMLANEISNLRLQLEDSRKHRFGRTSEQRRLLNNRNTSLQWRSLNMTVLTRKVMMIIRPMATVLIAIPLPVTYLHRTAGLQGKRKLLPVQKRPD